MRPIQDLGDMVLWLVERTEPYHGYVDVDPYGETRSKPKPANVAFTAPIAGGGLETAALLERANDPTRPHQDGPRLVHLVFTTDAEEPELPPGFLLKPLSVTRESSESSYVIRTGKGCLCIKESGFLISQRTGELHPLWRVARVRRMFVSVS